MKAVRVYEFGAPDVMRYEDAPEPSPGAGEVVVQVGAAGVNPVDTYIRAGLHSKPATPFTPGSDAAGVIHKIGTGVEKFTRGERVFVAGSLSGTYAEYALCREAQVYKLPDNVSDAEGAALGVPFGTAYRALFQKANARPDETVLIHGATGGVGIAAVQLAHAHNMKIIGTGGTQKGRALVFAQGADHALDHGEENYLQTVMEITEGRGVDVVLEMLANVNLGNDLGVLAARGRVVVIGNRGTVTINPRDLMSRDATVMGMSLFNASASDLVEIYEGIGAGVRDKILRPVIGSEMPLERAADAHRQIMQPGAYGKIVLVP